MKYWLRWVMVQWWWTVPLMLAVLFGLNNGPIGIVIRFLVLLGVFAIPRWFINSHRRMNEERMQQYEEELAQWEADQAKWEAEQEELEG